MGRMTIAGAAMALSLAALGAQAQGAAPNDYGKDEAWLCRPGRAGDACDIELSFTSVTPDGSFMRRTVAPNPDAPVDCFYVYPTASADPTPNSDMTVGPEEIGTVSRQLAPFAQACRIYAPIYRQITIPALRAATAGKPMATDRELAYRDVRDAWRAYLKRDNAGRGVVLFGHSQGAGVLKRLIQEEIDGKPDQKKIVSALLIGTNVLVPAGKDAGGDFRSMPICRRDGQTGCVISYVSFRAEAPPPQGSRFGRTDRQGMQVACANPAALAGGKAALDSVFGAKAMHPTAAPPKPWVTPDRPIETRYVQAPGLIAGECVSDAAGSRLAISVEADPADPRTDEISGDHLANGVVQPDWGLHSLDVPSAMGDLIDRVQDQGRAWTARRGGRS